ncbi:MAG: S8 family serine peptidase [Hyphomonadaceae bacterium JAD_PAG50586_4]|nr:MAG: S8 family serine peptidase [Hyphomonadaceae bacterium JAD_PAG50586_4]
MARLASLIGCALVISALCLGSLGLALSSDAAWASGRDDADDGPDFDDHDNSGSGSGDWDDDFDDDSSGPGGGADWADEPDDSDGDQYDDEDEDLHARRGDDDDRHDGDDRSREVGSVERANSEHVLYSVEYDDQWGEYVPDEVVLVGAASDVDRARGIGFRELSRHRLESGGIVARLRIPRRVSVTEAAAALAQAAPNALVTPNSVYRSAASEASPAPAAARPPSRLQGALGIIDTGVDVSALPASNAVLSQRAFAGARAIARPHGSAVAAIAIQNGSHVHVADVFGESEDGALAASTERIVAALDWMIANRVAVVNISVQGPNNAILGEMVRRAVDGGHIIVAAAGNGGPAARPTFPGAFDGVLAITAIDTQGRPYIRANRGAYIDFAALGVDVPVYLRDEAMRVTGTSFAAPIIAAHAAQDLQVPSRAQAAAIIAALQRGADDLGDPGHDHVFGWGAVRD